jgi:hypothetical protein
MTTEEVALAQHINERYPHMYLPEDPASYPRGGFIGLVNLLDVSAMNSTIIGAHTPMEREMGDWAVGRLAWVCTGAHAFPRRNINVPGESPALMEDDPDVWEGYIPARGQQRLWTPTDAQQAQILWAKEAADTKFGQWRP